MAALLVCQLVNSVLQSFKKISVKIKLQYDWTDSTIVLNWLSSEPRVWATFVSNRVAKIQENIWNLIWNHMQTHKNPADPEEWIRPSLRICQSGALVQIGSKVMENSF